MGQMNHSSAVEMRNEAWDDDAAPGKRATEASARTLRPRVEDIMMDEGQEGSRRYATCTADDITAPTNVAGHQRPGALRFQPRWR